MLNSELASLSGRAQFMALRAHLLGQQRKVHVEMTRLLETSRVSGSPITLVRHLPMSRGEHLGTWRLRWRVKSAGVHRHALWAELTHELALMPAAMRRHYQKLDRRVEELNAIDRLLQGSLNRCAGLLGLGGTSGPPD